MLPNFIKGFITYFVILHPDRLAWILAILIILYLARKRLKRRHVQACEAARQSLQDELLDERGVARE